MNTHNIKCCERILISKRCQISIYTNTLIAIQQTELKIHQTRTVSLSLSIFKQANLSSARVRALDRVQVFISC